MALAATLKKKKKLTQEGIRKWRGYLLRSKRISPCIRIRNKLLGTISHLTKQTTEYSVRLRLFSTRIKQVITKIQGSGRGQTRNSAFIGSSKVGMRKTTIEKNKKLKKLVLFKAWMVDTLEQIILPIDLPQPCVADVSLVSLAFICII